MNITAQTTPNLTTLIPTTPVSMTGNSIAPNNPTTNSVNISCPFITRVTENCDANVVSDSTLPPTVNNIFKGYSPFSSNVPFPPICINPLIPSGDQTGNTANSSNLQNSFPNLPAPVCSAAAAAATTTVSALKLLGSIFPHFSTTEYQQEASTPPTSEMPVNSKQAKLQANRNNANNEQISSPPGSPQSSVLRPYLCRFCRTRFQAFSTFQAHQQFYCQGRKEVMKQLQTTKTTSTASADTLASTSSPTSLNCPSNTGPSASKRRCTTTTTTTTTENASSSQLQTLGSVSASQRNSANSSSSTSSSGDEGDILKNNNNNRLSPLNVKSSPNRNILSSQEGNIDYETDQLTLAQWEPCGTSELRCSACGYVGQTPRGMKMHRKLHECNGTTFKTATRSTSEAKTRNDIKLEGDNLTNSSDVSLHHGNDSNSSSSNDGRNLMNNNNSNVANDSNSAFSDDHVKKEHL
uniref:Uncharacterized protein n=1 Tax=Trichobilharzia regenti TaxID=157069 RepID=A0AA85K6Z0_TRIRE|nr:unnamed protein product [Trichobilharzia regenti]